MKRIFYAIFLAFFAMCAMAQVSLGVDALAESSFKALKGKRVALITNPTGVNSQLQSTADLLADAPDVKLVALFAPEHGVRGDVAAGETVSSSVDAKTGVKVYSLYGRNKKPSAAMLKGVDAVVYDIQDNGCRSYTFISTMGLAMEACAQAGIEFVVLDRPNPLGGIKVEGSPVHAGWTSFVGQYRIPYIYGLTAGELATLLNGEGLLAGKRRCKLTVVKMQGWQRSMTYAETGLPWVLTSPHIPSAETALYYPATGILGELQQLSIGVGYTLPFKLVCAQWIDADKFAVKLNALHLKGVKFRPIHIKPFYAMGKGTALHGVEVYITDFLNAHVTLIQFYAMQVLHEMYPSKNLFTLADSANLQMFDKVCGTDEVRKNFQRRFLVEDIISQWNQGVDEFKELSKKYYLY